MAATRVRPNTIAKMIVAPEREVPGKTAAMICAAATTNTMVQVISLASRFFASRFSTSMKTMPPMINAAATGTAVSGSVMPSLSITSPPAAVATKAASTLRLKSMDAGLRQSAIILSRSAKSGSTASTAPLWITTLKRSLCL